jgi:hypothetical protein
MHRGAASAALLLLLLRVMQERCGAIARRRTPAAPSTSRRLVRSMLGYRFARGCEHEADTGVASLCCCKFAAA